MLLVLGPQGRRRKELVTGSEVALGQTDQRGVLIGRQPIDGEAGWIVRQRAVREDVVPVGDVGHDGRRQPGGRNRLRVALDKTAPMT